MKNFDIAIIGNGILALTTAFCLIKNNQKQKIAIIANNNRNGSASLASGAMLNYIAEVTDDTLKDPYSTKKLEIAIQASKLWEDFLLSINELSEEKEKITPQEGTYIILNSKSATLDTDNFFAIKEAAIKYNEPVVEINPKDIPGMNPLDDCRPLNALYLANEGSIDSNKLVELLSKILASNPNITFINQNVKTLAVKEDQVSNLVLLDNSNIYAQKILLAAGSYSQQIIDQIPELAKKIPRLLSGTGLSAVVSQSSYNKIQHVIRTPNRSGACGLHVLPRNQETLYIGATNNISFAPSTKHKLGLTQFLLQCTIDQVNQDLYLSEIINWHIGNRPVTVDTFPLAGQTSIKNLYLLTGTYRDGLQQAPFWGDYMANLMTQNENRFEHPFTPERKLLSTIANKHEAIKEVVKHYMAGFYEHGMRLARLFPEQKLENMLYDKFAAIYHKLDTNFPMKPDILFLFEISDSNDENIEFFKQYFKDVL